ncbi:hypothetical protein EJ03DRAFT_353651 [Teratosphaeria nubilosa]|uniref:Myb-like domain-containing protein n=1 Tax=Teratosphaeria nubilosa TaxID=161662 RepID=A0A6G1L1J5_9PEZI|nr:hypothetical protein EJ03DRAFT_353651 [Teratosphaeria nubilosa]
MPAAEKTNWESKETWERLVASIIATGVKIDLRATATYFGTTYDTLENRFRKIKKESAVLKQEVESGARGLVEAPRKANPSTPRKPKTPKKDALSTVTNGRISKTSPTKRSGIKQEALESFASSNLDADGDTDTFQDSFSTNCMNGGDIFDEFD